MDLACVHSMLQALRTRYDSLCHTNSPHHHPFTHPDHFLDDPAASYYPTLPWPALVHPFHLHFTATRAHCHLHLSFQEWAARMVGSPFFHSICPIRARTVPVPIQTYVMNSAMAARTTKPPQMDPNVICKTACPTDAYSRAQRCG